MTTYVLVSCIAYEGDQLITATRTLRSLIEKLRKEVTSEVGFGEYLELHFYNGDGDLIGSHVIAHSDIPGKKINFYSKNAGYYLDNTEENWSRLLGKLQSIEVNMLREFAAKQTDV
ncbi:hypothetical protein [Erwinia phage FBB1]|nr:hypothetical protein [Erwinia phage FBB1]